MGTNDLFREQADIEGGIEYAYIIVSSWTLREERIEQVLTERTNILAKQGYRVLGMTQYKSLTTIVMGRVRPGEKDGDD